MKKRVGLLFVGGFYTYTCYQITDAKKNVFYIAEPRGDYGATRGADTIAELQEIINKDKTMMDYIARQR